MKHLKQMSLIGGADYRGETTVVEQLILLFLGIFFADWTNFSAVIQNLSKFYAKT